MAAQRELAESGRARPIPGTIAAGHGVSRKGGAGVDGFEAARALRERSRVRDWNRTCGWASLALGVGSGLVLGLWSFDGPLQVPAWIGAYGDTSRRLVRLGHIALIGLGILDILLAKELVHAQLGPGAKRVASLTMILGNVSLPLALFAASLHRPLKYALAPAASCVFVALCIAAFGARRARVLPEEDSR